MSGSQQVQQISVELIDPNPYQPRETFDEVALAELARSIGTSGVHTPIKVRKHPSSEGWYQLAYGERRLRASKIAEKTTIPAIVDELDDKQLHVIALTENVQRKDLSPIEEAKSFKGLVGVLGDVFEVSQHTGKSGDLINSRIALLGLPEDVQKWVDVRQLTLGCAEELCAISDPDPEEQIRLARIAMKRRLTPVRLRSAIQQGSKVGNGGDERKFGRKKSGRKITSRTVQASITSCYSNVKGFAPDGDMGEAARESMCSQAETLRDALEDLTKVLRARSGATTSS